MPYALGIDVGRTVTSAAITRLDGSPRGDAEVVHLGQRSSAMPSDLHLADDGAVTVGEAARQRALTEPGYVATGIMGRIGDEVPLIIGGRPYPAHELAAVLIRWVADQVRADQGTPADHVVVTHPASWGVHRRGLLDQALRRHGLAELTLLPEPIAAAESHAAHTPLDAGNTLAAYDLGGSTFSAAVVRRNLTGMFELLQSTEADEHLGGTYFDDAVVDHIRAELGAVLADLDPADPQARLVMARFRRECGMAREALSTAPETGIATPAGPHVRITRTELEELIRPALDSSIEQLLRTVRSSTVDPRQLAATVLVGGCSRTPLIAELVSERLGSPVALDADPTATIAKGAALAARLVLTGAVLPAPEAQTMLIPRAREDDSADVYEIDERDEPPPRPPVEITELDLPVKRSAKWLTPATKPYVTAGVAVLAVAGIVLTFLLQAGTSNQQQSPITARTASVSTQTTQTTPASSTSGTDHR